MDGGLGAVANLTLGAIKMGQDQQYRDEYLSLTAQQQQFLRDQLAKIEGIAAPEFDTNLQAPQQLALSKYGTPQDAQSQQIAIDPGDRQMQMAALQKLQGLTSGAADSELNAANYAAMQNSARQNQAQTASILQNLASRGTAGSGLELAARLQAAQGGADKAQAGMLDAARNNALTKLQGLTSYQQGASALRGQDTDLAGKNADIINQFNMANTAARNRLNMANTDLQNQQNLYNTSQSNQYQKDLLGLKNSVAQTQFNDKLGQSQAAAGEANTISNQAMNAGATGIALGAQGDSAMTQGVGNALNHLISAYKPESASAASAGDSAKPDYEDPNYGWYGGGST